MVTLNFNPLCANIFRRAIALCLCLFAVAAAGCLPSSSDKADASGKNDGDVAEAPAQPRRGAEVMVGKKPAAQAGRDLRQRQREAEAAFYRDQYKKNRTVPPKEFAVKPKAPRNNSYGEFDQELYASLDSQPRLPGMPGGQDLMPMMGGPASLPVPPGDYPQHRADAASGGFHSYPPQARSVSGPDPRRSMSAATAQTVGAAGSGLMTDSRFYPIEQLVFGGEFPDLDKPELYRLMPKDVISITVKDHPEFSGKLEIQPDGTVRVANLPDLIRLRGLTVDEASEELRQTLQVYVKGECVVRIQTNRARGGYYFVFGDVLQPGRFPMGLEPIKLSDAVLAANWETNLARVDADGDELGPAFPTATPRGKFIAPRTADLANVMLVTPHRSKPVRTSHDVRQAMLGVTREDPNVRPGQIIIVPSLDPRRNASLGIDMPASETVSMNNGPRDANGRGGFSRADSSMRLPEVGSGASGNGYAAQGAGNNGRYDDPLMDRDADVMAANARSQSYGGNFGPSQEMMDCLTPVQRNMARNFGVQANTQAEEQCDEYIPYGQYYGGACESVEVPVMTASEWSGKKPRESAIPVAGTEVPMDDYNTMAAAKHSNEKQPKTDVRGIVSGDPGEPDEMVELRTRRGRRLPRPTPKTPEENAPKKDPGNWKMGF